MAKGPVATEPAAYGVTPTRPPRFDELDSFQKEQLRWLNTIYNNNYKLFNKQTEALAKL
jgi:hypothetical protein